MKESAIRYLDERALSIAVLFLMSSIALLTPVAAAGGPIQFTVQGYGTVRGQLENAVIQPNNTISINMLVNDQLQTSQGKFPIFARGIWNGIRNGSTLSGDIRDVTGKMQICILFACNDANFVGEGHWTGSLNATHATGNYIGTITFTNSQSLRFKSVSQCRSLERGLQISRFQCLSSIRNQEYLLLPLQRFY